MSLAVPGPCFPLVLAGSLLLCSACGSPPPDSPEPFLEQGPIAPEQALQQEISAHEIHAYDLELSPGQLLELEAESHRIDLEVTLFDETGRPLAELASPARRWGPERLLAIGESSGPHRLEVRSLGDTKATGGTYQLFLLAPRPATASDALRASAQSLQNEGLALSEHDRTPTNEQALPRFRQALDLWRRAGDERGAARSLHWLGLVLKDLNRYPEAEEHFRSALELWRQLEAGPEEAETIYRLGALHRLAGRLEAARESFDQALTKWQEVGDLEREALTFYNLGLVDWHQASMQDALERFTRARELHRRLDQKEAEAKSLNAIAAVHQMLGQSDRALEGFRAVLAIQEELGDLENQAATLSNLGWIHHRSRGELGLAAEYFERALRLAREREDLREQASMLSNLGRVFLDLGDPRAAFDRATQSFELETRNQNPDGQMGSLIVLGLALQAMEKPAEAIGSFEQALALSRALGTRTSEAEILYFLARSHRSSGELEDARSAIGQSLSILEALRTDVDSRSLKSTFLGFRRPYYELEIEVLVSLARLDPAGGFAGKALWASERARARALLETLAEMGDDFRTGVDAELLADAQTLRRQINELEHERWTADEAEQPTITRRLREQLEALEATELEIRRQSPRYADLARPRPLGLEEIREQVLDPRSLLLEYSLSEEKSFLFAVTRQSIEIFELPARGVIEDAAQALYRILTDRYRWFGPEARRQQARYREAASRLSSLVLGPVVHLLADQRLLIVPEGALHSIPFAALPPPDLDPVGDWQPLVLDHEIVHLPSASALAVLRHQLAGRAPAPKTLALLADPVFQPGDPRLQRPGTVVASEPDAEPPSTQTRAGRGDFARLRHSRIEAERIAAMVAPPERLLGLDFAASRSMATSSELARYRFLHFATHGVLNQDNPDLSGLVLSLVDEKGTPRDGFVPLHEIYGLELNAELVVLSACQSGLGQSIRGEGLVGLVRGFFHAGVPRVIASLWQIDDQATAALMEQLYRGLLQQGLPPAAALRRAQLEIYQNPPKPAWKSPYSWGAFVLQGEWRAVTPGEIDL